jgi:AcrR family transcriptional regulator
MAGELATHEIDGDRVMDTPKMASGATSDGPGAAPGRPPRPRRAQAILDATRELLAERGVHGLTVESVAARAGVAKTTIYRRYRSKNDLALAVLIDMVDDAAAMPEVGDTRAEWVAFVDRTVEILHTTLMGRVMQGLVSDLAADAELAQAYRERVAGRRLADVRRLVERGVARGDLRPDSDPELVTALLLGPIYYRLFLSGAPLDDTFGEQLVASVLPGFATGRLLNPPNQAAGAWQR